MILVYWLLVLTNSLEMVTLILCLITDVFQLRKKKKELTARKEFGRLCSQRAGVLAATSEEATGAVGVAMF